MKFEIFSAKYFEEEEVYEWYKSELMRVGNVSYFCDIETGNPVIELEISSLDDLIKLSNFLHKSLKLSRPYKGVVVFKYGLLTGIWNNSY